MPTVKQNTPKAFVFDAYGTLFRLKSGVLSVPPDEQLLVTQIQDTWRLRQVEYTWLSAMMGRWIDFDEVTRSALDYALEFHEARDESLKEKLLTVYSDPTTFDDVPPTLEYLKEKGIPLAILSNGNSEKLQSALTNLGINGFFQAVLSAAKVKTYKPSPSVYQLVTDHFRCEPKEVVFISSNGWDIAGAASFGFYTVWVNRLGIPFEQLGVAPNQKLNSLKDFVYPLA